MTPGEQVVHLDAGTLGHIGNGIYFYKLEVDGKTLTRKLMLMRQ